MMKLWIALFATCVTFAFGSTIAPAATTPTTAPSATATPVVIVSPTTTISQVTNSVTESSSTGSTTTTTTQAPVYNCTSGEFNTTGLTYSMCSAGCYAVLNNNTITYGCADIVKTVLDDTWDFKVCNGDRKYGECRDITVSSEKSESCAICCAVSNCNDAFNNREAFKPTKPPKPESGNSAPSVVANLVSVFIVAISAKLF